MEFIEIEANIEETNLRKWGRTGVKIPVKN
jgi:hypothetical protein